jgi:hypothetical protein
MMAKKNKKWKVKLTDEDAKLYDLVYNLTINVIREEHPSFNERMVDFRKIILNQMNNISRVEKLMDENDQSTLDFYKIESGTDLEKVDYLAKACIETYAGFFSTYLIADSVAGTVLPYPGIEKSPIRYYDSVFSTIYYFYRKYPTLYERTGISALPEEVTASNRTIMEKLLKFLFIYIDHLFAGGLHGQINNRIRELGSP